MAVGAIGLLLIHDGFMYLTGALGLTVLLATFAYDVEGTRSFLQSLVFASVCGFTLAITSVPVWTQLLGVANDPQLSSKWVPLSWLGGTVLFLVIDRTRMGSRVGSDQRTESYGLSAVPQPRMMPRPAPPPQEAPISAPPPAEPSFRVESSEPRLIRDEPAVRPVTPPTPVALPPGKEVNIYVNLTGEGLNVLRSVRAEHLGRDFYRIIDVMPPDETWEYPPGAVVRCRKKSLSSGKALVAFEEAPKAQ